MIDEHVHYVRRWWVQKAAQMGVLHSKWLFATSSVLVLWAKATDTS